MAAVVLLCRTPLLADEYSDALKRAKAEDKPVVLYFFSQWCPYCTAMQRDVLADKEVSAIMKRDVVAVRIDADKRHDLAMKYGIRGYPTSAILEPSGKSVIRVPGYLDKKEFVLVLDYARKKAYKSTTLKEYFKRAGIDVD